MDRWEYLCLAVADGKPHTQNGYRVEPQWAGVNAFDYLNHLGGQGWELVSTSEITGKKNTVWLYLKRRLKKT
jgi:hypothetical protein